MNSMFFACTLSAILAGEADAGDQVEKLRGDVIALLRKIDVEAKDPKEAAAQLRQEMNDLIDKYPKLRPEKDSATYVSNDKSFVLVIGANGKDGGAGASVKTSHDDARIVLAVAGAGGEATKTKEAGAGGAANCSAKKGVAIALGGTGGKGIVLQSNDAFRILGGAGGGGASASGGQGSVILGGDGGEGGKKGGMQGGKGGAGGGLKIVDPKKILDAVKEMK